MLSAAQALEHLGAQTGLGELAFDDEGVCGLIVGEDMELFFHGDADEDVLQITGVVGDLRDDVLARRLLELNAADHNGPAAFAADPLTGEILLTRHLSLAELSPEAFLAVVEDFVDRLGFWTEYLPRMDIRDDSAIDSVAPDAVVLRG